TVQLCPAQHGAVAGGADRPLCLDPAGRRLEEPDTTYREPELREALGNLAMVQDLVLQAVTLGGPDRARDGLHARPTHVEPAGEVKQLPARLALQLGPELVGALQQRDIAVVLMVDLA